MSDQQLIWLMMASVGGTGLGLVITAGILYFLRKRKIKKCCAITTGSIVKHNYRGGGRMFPVVEYCVDGTEYSVKRRFAGIVTEQKISPSSLYADHGAYVSKRDFLHVPMSAVTNLRTMADTLWPIGGEMQVFYNPMNPKQAYAERIPNKYSFEMIVFSIAGAAVILLAVLMCVIIRLT